MCVRVRARGVHGTPTALATRNRGARLERWRDGRTQLSMYECVCVCVRVGMHVCMYACMNASMYVRMYVCMYVCMYYAS